MSEENVLTSENSEILLDVEPVDPTDVVRSEEASLFKFHDFGVGAGDATTTYFTIKKTNDATQAQVFDKGGGYYNVVAVYANGGANAAKVKLQASLDKVNWIDIGTEKTGIAAATVVKDEFSTDFPYLRALVGSNAVTAPATAVSVKLQTKYYK